MMTLIRRLIFLSFAVVCVGGIALYDGDTAENGNPLPVLGHPAPITAQTLAG